MTMKTISGVWLSLLVATGCATEVGQVGASSGTTGASEPRQGDWDEARSVGVDPCGGAPLDTCDRATGGACGVVSDGAADLCLPLFPWGVTPTGTVQLASTQRIFTLGDLATRPLSEGERDEAALLQADLAEALVSSDHDVEPLASIDHSTAGCVLSYYYCNTTAIGRFWYHYSDSRGYHFHLQRHYRNLAWPACIPSASLLSTTTILCGRP